MAGRPERRAVIFDGDDTLWLTEVLYDKARDAARAIVVEAGFDGARWEELERVRDVINVDQLGHSPERFPSSCVDALLEIALQASLEVDPRIRQAVWEAAAEVFMFDAPLRRHAAAVVPALVARGLVLGLLTKGDPDVQQRRVSRSGLAQFFKVIEIVETKASDDFRRVVTRLGFDPAEVVSVGNSVRSDILPSVDAGVDAILISAHVWEYERTHDDVIGGHMAHIDELDQLLRLL